MDYSTIAQLLAPALEPWLVTSLGLGIRVRAYNNANLTIATSVATALPLNSERYDTDNMHNTAALTTRLTCNTAGLYVISGAVRFAANATGIREIGIMLNATTNLALQDSHTNSGAFDMIMTVTTEYELVVGDFLELTAFQNTGGNLNVVSTGNFSPEFMAARIA